MTDSWDSYAADWDDQPGTKAYAEAAFASLLHLLGGTGIELRGAKVVDFGCGTGLLTEQLVEADATVTAVDSSRAMLAVLDDKASNHRWTGVHTTSRLDEVPTGNDLIVCSSVCSFLDDYPSVATRLTRHLRSGGLFVQWDWERDGDDHGLSRDEIIDALTDAGLDDIVVTAAFELEVGGQMLQPLVGCGRKP